MINTPHITQLTPQLVARIHLTIPRNEMQMVMGPGLNEIMTAVKAQGIGIAGPWFTLCGGSGIEPQSGRLAD